MIVMVYFPFLYLLFIVEQIFSWRGSSVIIAIFLNEKKIFFKLKMGKVQKNFKIKSLVLK